MKIVAEPKNLNEISFEQRKKDLKMQDRIEQEELKQERKSPFRAFYQVNKEHSEDLMWLVKTSPNAYRILLFLFDHMDKYNAVMCSYNVLQEALEISDSTVKRAIRVLKEYGFIHICKSGTSNVYITNPDLAWNSWGNNKQYCEFPANIILSASEQEEKSKVHNKKIQTVQIKEQHQ